MQASLGIFVIACIAMFAFFVVALYLPIFNLATTV
jgi:hypothetical protein